MIHHGGAEDTEKSAPTHENRTGSVFRSRLEPLSKRSCGSLDAPPCAVLGQFLDRIHLDLLDFQQ